MFRFDSAFKYSALAVGPLCFVVLMAASSLWSLQGSGEVNLEGLSWIACVWGIFTVLIWPGLAALILVLRDWKARKPLASSTLAAANLAVGPLIFALLVAGFTAATLAADPDPNAGASLGILAGSVILTVLLWPAAVAVLLNVRDRLARQHGPQSDGL